MVQEGKPWEELTGGKVKEAPQGIVEHSRGMLVVSIGWFVGCLLAWYGVGWLRVSRGWYTLSWVFLRLIHLSWEVVECYLVEVFRHSDEVFLPITCKHPTFSILQGCRRFIFLQPVNLWLICRDLWISQSLRRLFASGFWGTQTMRSRWSWVVPTGLLGTRLMIFWRRWRRRV